MKKGEDGQPAGTRMSPSGLKWSDERGPESGARAQKVLDSGHNTGLPDLGHRAAAASLYGTSTCNVCDGPDQCAAKSTWT